MKQLFLSFKGRIGRRDFWLVFVIVFAGMLVSKQLPTGLGLLVVLVLSWPLFAVQAKRLHDLGWSGWVQVIPSVLSGVCMQLAMNRILKQLMEQNASPDALLEMATQPEALLQFVEQPGVLRWLQIAFAVQIAFLVWIGAVRGAASPNKFGPPVTPLAPKRP